MANREMTETAPRSTVIVTRPKEDAAPLIDLLRERGHEVIAFPVLGIEPVDDSHTLAATMARIDAYRLVVFVSPNAIRHAIAHRQEPWPRDVTIAVMGPGSVAALCALGIASPEVQVVSPQTHPALQDALGLASPSRSGGAEHARPNPFLTPDPSLEGEGIHSNQRYDSEALLAALDSTIAWHPGFGGRVLIVRGNGGRSWFADRLRERGIAVDEVESYRRTRPEPDAESTTALRKLFVGNRRVLFVITSSEGLVNLVALVESHLGVEARDWLFDSRIVAPHARIAEKAREMGFYKVSLAAPGDRGIVAAIE